MSISEEKEMLELEGLIEEHGLTGKAGVMAPQTFFARTRAFLCTGCSGLHPVCQVGIIGTLGRLFWSLRVDVVVVTEAFPA